MLCSDRLRGGGYYNHFISTPTTSYNLISISNSFVASEYTLSRKDEMDSC